MRNKLKKLSDAFWMKLNVRRQRRIDAHFRRVMAQTERNRTDQHYDNS